MGDAVVKPAKPAGVVELPSPTGGPFGMRVFDDAAIQASVERAVARIPEGKRAGIVFYMDNDETVRVAVMGKLNGLGAEWSIALAGEKKPGQRFKDSTVTAEAVAWW